MSWEEHWRESEDRRRKKKLEEASKIYSDEAKIKRILERMDRAADPRRAAEDRERQYKEWMEKKTPVMAPNPMMFGHSPQDNDYFSDYYNRETRKRKYKL